MSTAQQVIDDIDALVDEQLLQEASGYDHNLNQPRCRCGAGWHGMKLGACPGSRTEGPLEQWALGTLKQDLGQLTSAFTSVATEIGRVFRSMTFTFSNLTLTPEGRTLLGVPDPSRCTLAARRRMHSDQLRVQRRAVRRARRARRREAEYHPLEVHDDHVILTVIPDVSGFRRELRRTYDPS